MQKFDIIIDQPNLTSIKMGILINIGIDISGYTRLKRLFIVVSLLIYLHV